MTLAEMLGQPGAAAWLKPGDAPDPGGEWRLWNMGGEMAWMKIPGYATPPDAPRARQRASWEDDPSVGWDAADWIMQHRDPPPYIGKKRGDRLEDKIRALVEAGKLKQRADVTVGGVPAFAWDDYWPSPGEARVVGDAFRHDMIPWDDRDLGPNPYRWPNWNELPWANWMMDSQPDGAQYEDDMAAEAQGQLGLLAEDE